MRPRTLHRLACLMLVVLMGLAVFQAAEASTRILWRFMVLSWDNPATQILDELICESAPPSHAGTEAGLSARLAIQNSAHVADPVLAQPRSSALSSGITRSPPAA